MALNAFAIDSMIPALPDRALLTSPRDNHRQLVVMTYFLGFSDQILWGPLADRFGRKPILARVSRSTRLLRALRLAEVSLLIAGRMAMGAAAAVTRVLVIAMVRDLFEGEAMARVMSLVFMVFMLVPVLAPNIGQVDPVVGVARDLSGAGRLRAQRCGWWCSRLPETLHPEFRRKLESQSLAAANAAHATGCRSAIRWR